MQAALLAIALAGSSDKLPALEAPITLSGDRIHVGDVMQGVGRTVAAIEIARLPSGRASVTLSRDAVAALIRRAVPSLTLGSDAPARMTFRRVSRMSPRCFVARQAVAAGAAIDAGQVRSGECNAAAAAVRYDRRLGTIVASRAIPAGGGIGRALPATTPTVSRGDALTLVSRSGPVTVERSVSALQSGHRGGRVFVRAASGPAFSVEIAREGS